VSACDVAVLDACAVIAYLNDEEGASEIDRLIEEGCLLEVSAINALEVAYDAVRQSGSSDCAEEIIAAIEGIPCRIEWTLSSDLLARAAILKAHNRISLADSVALALANSRGTKLVTSDHHEFDAFEARGDAAFLWIR